MTTPPKLLVLGSSLPGGKDGGGVVRDEILRRYPSGRYVCFALRRPDQSASPGELPESLQRAPWQAKTLYPTWTFRGARFYMPLMRAFALLFVAPWRARQAVAFGRKHGVELVWAEFYGDAVCIAERVARGLGVPLVGTVWDDPEGWLADGGYDFLSRRYLSRCFQSALKTARKVSTAGEAMQRAYEHEHGIRSVILRHGFDSPVSGSGRCGASDKIIIGFVGSSYGRDAWTAFLAALARMNASGEFPRIRLRAFGGGTFPYRHPGVDIEARGWQPSDVMLREIAETDFCYLPYWFQASKRRHAELSFPNKFETYLAAGRPVVFHGPAYAGIAAAVEQYGVGICIHTLCEDEILARLGDLIRDHAARRALGKAAMAAFHAEFNAEIMMRNFSALIGAGPDSLQTSSME